MMNEYPQKKQIVIDYRQSLFFKSLKHLVNSLCIATTTPNFEYQLNWRFINLISTYLGEIHNKFWIYSASAFSLVDK